MSRTHRSPGPRLEALREELLEKERFMSHGYQSFQSLLEAFKSRCTTVWTKDTVVYRCRTCQINDSSAICEICFHQGDHKLHDFIMYHSESGGCCDCGDRDAWKEDGICNIHQGHLPAELYHTTRMTEKLSISVHIIWAIRLKDQKAPVENEMLVARLYMEWVKQVCSVDVLRNLLSVLVTRKFLDGSQLEKNARGRRKAPLEILLKTLGSMPKELREGATTLFLQMQYNGWFKSQFAEELMKHYPLMVDDAVCKGIKHPQHEVVITQWKALDSTLDRGTGSPDIAELASAYFGTFSDSADWLSSMLITNQEEHCDLPMQMVGQVEQPVLDQLHCIAAAHKGQPSSSHQGRYIATQPVCIESPFGQGGDILNPTTIMSGQPCLAPYDKGKQQEEQRHDSIVWSPVPQQDVPGFVNLPDSTELSEIPGSLNYLEGESVEPILLHEPKCSEIDRMHVYNLKTDCNGYIVGEKSIWQSQLKSYMYRILDFGILEIRKQPRANLDKIYAKMNEDFTYSPYLLNKDVVYNYIRDRLRDLRCKWKKKWQEQGDRPSECSEAAWKTLIEHWSTEKVMAEAEKMKKARGAVKNPSHVGRGGRT